MALEGIFPVSLHSSHDVLGHLWYTQVPPGTAHVSVQDGFAALELFSSLPIWVEDAAPVTPDLPDMEVLAHGPGILTLCHLVKLSC